MSLAAHHIATFAASTPQVAVEIVTPTTAFFDFLDRIEAHEADPRTAHILAVNVERPQVRLYSKDANGTWSSKQIAGLDAVVEMPAAGRRLRLADIYAENFRDDWDATVARMAEHTATLWPADALEDELDWLAVWAVKDYRREHAGRWRVAEIRARRARAIRGARAAVAVLADLDVRAVIIGSLAKGKFGLHSDVDLLITSCPHHLKYAIEGVVEDALEGLPFDVVYLDEIPAWRLPKFTDGAMEAADLA